jgi:predicted Zn-dependent peptidase
MNPRRALTLSALLATTLAAAGLQGCGPLARSATRGAPATAVRAGDFGAPPVGRAAVDALKYPPLEVHPRVAEELELSNGVTVFYMEDRSLPLVNIFALYRGGSSYFERSYLAATTAIGSSLLLSGGTETMSPDSVDFLIEHYALAPSFTTAGTASMAGIETLTRNLDLALDLWTEMLRAPRLDPERVEHWRLRELESVRRLDDAPGSLAISEFNQLLFGEHPIGWQLGPDDLHPERLAEERLRRVHRAIFCKENMTLGIVGDISRADAAKRLEAAFGDWPACPEKLTPPALPELRRDGGVLVVQRPVNQSSLVMGQPGGIIQRDHPEYYASQVANFILGGGGLSSRVTSRVRTEEGLAYNAGTVWVAGTSHERIFGAFAQTRGDATIAAVNLIRDVLEDARRDPPTAAEVRDAIDYTANGFVFAFGSPAQTVMRRLTYRLAGLPDDWLERFLAGIQQVTPNAVHEVIREKIHPESWTFVIVGDTTRFDRDVRSLGELIKP